MILAFQDDNLVFLSITNNECQSLNDKSPMMDTRYRSNKLDSPPFEKGGRGGFIAAA